MSNYHFTESVLIAFGMDDMDIYADMSVYELFDKSKILSIYRKYFRFIETSMY